MNRKSFLVITAIIIFCAFAPNAEAADREVTQAFLDQLEWRNIGPANMGGRIDDFAVVESDPRIIYAGTASAGVWKTTNNGITW
jgi:hypothetical protein